MNQRIENEIEALSNIYFDKMNVVPDKEKKTIELTLISDCLQLQKNETPSRWVKIRVEFHNKYPLIGPIITIFEQHNVKEAEIENINKQIQQIIQNRIKQNYEMVHEICQYIESYINKRDTDSKEEEKSSESPYSNNSSVKPKKSKKIRKSSTSSGVEKIQNHKNLFENLRDMSSSSNNNNNIITGSSDDSKQNNEKPDSGNLFFTSRFHSDFEVKNKLGEGGGGSVFKVRNKWDGMMYAIKIIQVNIYNAVDEKRVLSKVLNEGYVLSRLQHYNIVRYYQTWVEDCDKNLELLLNENESSYNLYDSDDSNLFDDVVLDDKNTIKKVLFIQMEFCEGKTLKEAIDSGALTEEQKWKLIIELLNAINYIHKNGLIHRDIKPGNIFLGKNNEVKLGDFGLAKVTKKNQADEAAVKMNKEYIKVNNGKTNDDFMTYNIGTKYYCSPEQEKRKIYNNKTDMYSLGIIIFEMFYTFKNLIDRDKVLRVVKDKHTFPKEFLSSKPNIVQLVFTLTETNPEKRPSAIGLLNSDLIPFIVNKGVITGNFKKLIYDNKEYTEAFIDILIKSSCSGIFKNYSNLNDHSFFYSKLLSEYPNDNPRKRLEQFNELNRFIKSFFVKSIKFIPNSHTIYHPIISIYDSLLKKIFHFEKDKHSPVEEDLMLTKNCNVFTNNTIAGFFLELENYLNAEQILSDFIPYSFYCNINYEIIYSEIWKSSELFDVDEKYIIRSFHMLFEILRKLGVQKNKIWIKMNTSRVLDLICSKKIPVENVEQKIKTLLEIEKGKIPDELQNMLSMSGDIKTMENKSLKKDLAKEVEYISNIFCGSSIFWERKVLSRFKDKIKIDFGLISQDLNFYSGLIFQVAYYSEEENKEIVIVEGGNVDNLINHQQANDVIYHGFSIRFFLDKIMRITHGEEETEQSKLEFIVMRDEDVRNKEYKKFLKKIKEKKSGDFEVLSKPQKFENISFGNFYKIYKMSAIIYIQVDKNEEFSEEESEFDEGCEENEEELGVQKILVSIISKEKIKVIKEIDLKWEEFTQVISDFSSKKRKQKS